MHLIVTGLSHKTTPLTMRERFAIPEEKIGLFLTELLQNEDVQEAMLLSTCNRVETYLVSRHTQRASEVARQLFSQLSSKIAGRGDEQDLEKCIYTKEEGEAVAHLFRVTAGLDSLILGEPQITGQVKEAYAMAVAAEATGPYLNRLVHRALHVSKKIRTETGIGHLPVSISYAAVLLAEKIFGDLKERKVLLLGTGEMGALAARHLAERNVGEIWLSNRTGERASEVAEILRLKTIPYDEVKDRLEEVDILIVSTAATDYVVLESDVREAMRRRKNRPMFFIDIAVPRNIEPAVNLIENVYLYDIDHLEGVVENNRREREREARRAEGIIAEEVEDCLHALNQIDLSPMIRELSRKFESIREKEVKKYLARLKLPSDHDREALEACTKAIVGKILHDPIIQLKSEEPKEGAPKYSEILKKLFRLEGEG